MPASRGDLSDNFTGLIAAGTDFPGRFRGRFFEERRFGPFSVGRASFFREAGQFPPSPLPIAFPGKNT